jgi:hypothetical protein
VQGKTVNFRQKPKDKNNIMSPTAMETEGSTRLFVELPNSTEIEHNLVFGVDLQKIKEQHTDKLTSTVYHNEVYIVVTLKVQENQGQWVKQGKKNLFLHHNQVPGATLH